MTTTQVKPVYVNKCTSKNLNGALAHLNNEVKALNPDNQITGIDFEDGSGYKFNYRVNNGKWTFVDLTGKIKLQ